MKKKISAIVVVAENGAIGKNGDLLCHLPADLKHFGLIPELIGRFPMITYLHPLTADALRRILTEPKNALVKQYQALFKMDKAELTFEDAALDAIVQYALSRRLGARGLRGIMETILNDLMFDLPGRNESKIEITAQFVEQQLSRKPGKTK